MVAPYIAGARGEGGRCPTGRSRIWRSGRGERERGAATAREERRRGGEERGADKRGEQVGARGGEGGAWRSTGKREGRSTTLGAPRLRGGARGRLRLKGEGVTLGFVCSFIYET